MMRVKVEKSEDVVHVLVDGILDGQAEIGPEMIGDASKVVFDLTNLRAISSTGIRLWSDFINQLVGRKLAWVFINCPSVFIEQVAMLPDLLPRENITIDSFFAPYYCESCDEEQSMLCKPDEYDEGIPAKPCPSCSSSMYLDDLADEFNVFLNRLRATRQS